MAGGERGSYLDAGPGGISLRGAFFLRNIGFLEIVLADSRGIHGAFHRSPHGPPRSWLDDGPFQQQSWRAHGPPPIARRISRSSGAGLATHGWIRSRPLLSRV